MKRQNTNPAYLTVNGDTYRKVEKPTPTTWSGEKTLIFSSLGVALAAVAYKSPVLLMSLSGLFLGH